MKKTTARLIMFFLALVITACGGGGGGGGGNCNIAAGQFCDIGNYCSYIDNSCGRNGTSGTCTQIPISCPATVQPVCTCDSLSFNNDCLAAQSGQSVQALGECV